MALSGLKPGIASGTAGTIESMQPSDAERVREAEAVRRARLERDAALTPRERLERVHELCRQLAALRLREPPGR